MPHSAPSDHQQQPDYMFVAVLCICVLIIPVSAGIGMMSLQRLLQPAEAVLFGPTADGELMCVIPMILLSLLASFRVAWPLTRRIQRGLRMPDKVPLLVAAWVESRDRHSINWRLAAGIAGVILLLIAAKGFGSTFYVTESGVFVRPPLEFSMRHYQWRDVTTVTVHCRHSIVKRENRFRYILQMSDGQEVDLSGALSSVSPRLRAALAVRFAAFIPSRLNTVPSIRYEFNVSQDALASLGEQRGVVLSNALREQVLEHGGTLQ